MCFCVHPMFVVHKLQPVMATLLTVPPCKVIKYVCHVQCKSMLSFTWSATFSDQSLQALNVLWPQVNTFNTIATLEMVTNHVTEFRKDSVEVSDFQDKSKVLW